MRKLTRVYVRTASTRKELRLNEAQYSSSVCSPRPIPASQNIRACPSWNAPDTSRRLAGIGNRPLIADS